MTAEDEIADAYARFMEGRRLPTTAELAEAAEALNEASWCPVTARCPHGCVVGRVYATPMGPV